MPNIKIVIDSVPIKDEYMSLAVYVNDQCLREQQSLTEKLELNFATSLPLKVEFEVSGKNEYDTEVDELGNILNDKHIVIEAICIDGIWIKKWVLEKKLFSPTLSNYFGQNGHYCFAIPYDDVLDFWLDTCIVD